jgi:hypothetical protein
VIAKNLISLELSFNVDQQEHRLLREAAPSVQKETASKLIFDLITAHAIRQHFSRDH